MDLEETRDCWHVKLEVCGEPGVVESFYERLRVPSELLDRHANFEGPELLGSLSFSFHVPPPSLSASSKVLYGIASSVPEVPAAWAVRNWGASSDIIENSEPVKNSENTGSAVTFLCYGGMPVKWCVQAANFCESESDCEVVLKLVGYESNSYRKAQVFIYSSKHGLLESAAVATTDAHITQVSEFLKKHDFMWDGLTMGPFLEPPPIPDLFNLLAPT